jgi:hypothetical protein
MIGRSVWGGENNTGGNMHYSDRAAANRWCKIMIQTHEHAQPR